MVVIPFVWLVPQALRKRQLMTGFHTVSARLRGAPLDCLHLPVPDARAGIVWSFGSGGGFHGPAGGLYDRRAQPSPATASPCCR